MHPKNPTNKPHLLRLQKSLISDSAQNLTILTCGKREGFCDSSFALAEYLFTSKI